MDPARRKTVQAALAVSALLALVLTGAEAAWAKGGHGGGHSGHGGGRSGAHHGHHHGVSSFPRHGSPVFFGSYWAFPSYWYAQSNYLPAEPVYYIERSEEELRSPSVWYYCEGEAAYYPYVKQCPEGWVPVEPFNVP